MKKKILLSLLFIFVSQLNAADIIYAWGYGDLMNSVLTAVSFTFASGDFMGIFKFALLIAVVMALISSAKLGLKGDMLSLPKLFLMSIGVSTLFISWKIDVVVQDATANQTYLVSQVPWGVAKPLVWFTGMEEEVGNIMETTFAVPGGLTYNAGGFLAPFGIMDAAGTARISDPDLLKSIDGFFQNCVAPDVANGYYDVATLASSTDLWSEFSSVNPSLVSFDYKNGSQTLMDCGTLYSTLTGDMQNWVSGNGMAGLGQVLGGMAGAQVSSILGTASQFFLGYQQSGESYLMQSVVSNQFNDSYSSWATANGTSNSAMAYGIGKGEQTAQANMIISGTLGGKYLPVIKGILTIIIVGLTPIVALLLITPMFWKILTSYLITLIWLSLWHIGELILNFIILVKASSNMAYIANGTGDYTLMTKPVIDSSFMDYVNMAGSMYWMIPSIAGLIVGGFSYMAMSGLAGSVGGSVQSGPRGVASEVAGGSASFGNVGMNSFSANAVSAASALSVGTNANVSNSFTSNNGSNVTNANATAAGGKYTIGGKQFDNFGAYSSSGNIDTMRMKGSATSSDGNTTIGWDSGTTFDNKTQMPISGNISRADKSTGTKTEETWENGVLKESKSTLSGGWQVSSTERDGVTQTTISNAETGSSMSYTMDKDGNYHTIGQKGEPITITDMISKQREASMTKAEKAQAQAAIEAVRSGKTTNSSALEFNRQAVIAAANGNTNVSAKAEEKAKTAMLSSIKSVLKNESKDKTESWLDNASKGKTDSVTETELASMGVNSKNELLGKVVAYLSGGEAKASAGIQHASMTEDGFTYTDSKGISHKHSYSESFKHDQAVQLANIQKVSDTNSSSQSIQRTNSTGVSTKTGHSTVVEDGKSFKHSESFTDEINNSYAEKISSSSGVSDGNAVANTVSSHYLNNLKDGGLNQQGVNAAIVSLLSQNTDSVKTYKELAERDLGINESKLHDLNQVQNVPDSSIVTVVQTQTANANNAYKEASAVAPSVNETNKLFGNHGGDIPTVGKIDYYSGSDLGAQYSAAQKDMNGAVTNYQNYSDIGDINNLGKPLNISGSGDPSTWGQSAVNHPLNAGKTMLNDIENTLGFGNTFNTPVADNFVPNVFDADPKITKVWNNNDKKEPTKMQDIARNDKKS